MTLEGVKELLNKNEIPYHLCEYENEAEYWRHSMLFPYVKHSKSCKVFVIVIQSKNGHVNLELQFNMENGTLELYDLHFGGYSHELFNCDEEIIQKEIIDTISEITSGKMKIITVNDLKAKRWLEDICFDTSDSGDDMFGMPGFQKAMKKIQKKKSFLAKAFKLQTQYEIYDWNTYECIVK